MAHTRLEPNTCGRTSAHALERISAAATSVAAASPPRTTGEATRRAITALHQRDDERRPEATPTASATATPAAPCASQPRPAQ